MYNLIENLQPVAATSNIPSVGYQTLLCLVATTGADYEGTKAEADALKAGLTIKVADATADDGVDLDGQYVKARTIAGTKTAMIEIILTKAYVKTLTFGSGITATAKFLTLPSNSLV